MVVPADLVAEADSLTRLVRTDPCPQVRRRAQCLLTWTHCPSLATAVTQTQTSRSSLSRWRARFLAEGRDGLVDHARSGRPCKLPSAGDTLLETALTQPPTAYGYATACWTLVDLQDLLARHGWRVAIATVERHLHQLGYVYRRPRHDLVHRQNADAVASAEAVLAALRKKGVLTMADCTLSISMSAISIPIRTWLLSGNDEGSRP